MTTAEIRKLALTANITALGTLALIFGYYIQLSEFFWYLLIVFLTSLTVELCGVRHALTFLFALSFLFLLLSGFGFIYLFPAILLSLYPVIRRSLKLARLPRPLSLLCLFLWFEFSLFLIYSFTLLMIFPFPILKNALMCINLSLGALVWPWYNLLVKRYDWHIERLRFKPRFE